MVHSHALYMGEFILYSYYILVYLSCTLNIRNYYCYDICRDTLPKSNINKKKKDKIFFYYNILSNIIIIIVIICLFKKFSILKIDKENFL